MEVLLALAIGCGGVLASSAYTIQSYKQGPDARIAMPQSPDSVQKENPFSAEKLLDARKWEPTAAEAAGWTTLTTDSTGVLHFASDSKAGNLRTFRTRLRAERFAKGKLILSSTSRAAVAVDGKRLITKNSADSLAAEQDSPITLNPENEVEITVDLLSMPDDKSAPEFSLRFVPDQSSRMWP